MSKNGVSFATSFCLILQFKGVEVKGEIGFKVHNGIHGDWTALLQSLDFIKLEDFD